MDKKQARDYIETIFSSAFDRTTFTRFIHELLNDIEVRDRNYSGNLIPESFRQHIRQYWRLGKYICADGEEVDILVVEVKSLTKLDRARTALRNFAINRLKTFDKDFSLIAFYAKDDNGADWRFSFIKIEHQAWQDDKGKIKNREELTPAKRYSYLVGEHETSWTAQKQLLSLLENDYAKPTLEEIENAFSVEKVTDEFFEQYKNLYLKLSDHISRNPLFKSGSAEDKQKNVARFAKKLLGQIVFLYFLQKKGWLGVAKKDPWGKGDRKFLRNRYHTIAESAQNYYTDFLQHLFYEALAVKRKNDWFKLFDCKLPFLNGGLFEADYDWQSNVLNIDNDIFHNQEKNKAGDIGTGILDVFDRYNFTIKEDEPLEKEVAVDPEMLGKVFENMLDTTTRKNMGAFYTPREIVHYMCQESLIHYLDNCLNTYVDTPELEEHQGDIFSNSSSQQSLGSNNIEVPKADIETLVRKGYLYIENDEAALRALSRIEKGEQKSTRQNTELPDSIKKNAKIIDQALADVKVCDPAIGSGAYPVGLLHEIVNIRLALATHSGNTQSTYALKRHVISESHYGVDIDPSAIDIARLRLWLSLIVDEEDFDKIEALPNLDYKIVQGDSLIGFPENWNSPAFRQLEKMKKKFFEETDHDKKNILKKKINTEMQQRLDSSKKIFGYDVSFDFRLMFSEVWHEKNGFDIVIGNPPYKIEYDPAVKKTYEALFNCFKRNNDLYVAFFQKGIRLLSNVGSLIYITPNTFINGDYFKELRKFFTQNYSLLEIVDFKSNHVFADPTVFVAITHISNALNSNDVFYKTSDISITKFQTKKLNIIRGSDASFIPHDPILDKLYKVTPIVFEDVFMIKDVGFNYWTKGGAKNRKGNSIGKRVFIKEKKSHLDDIPYLKGRNINRYAITNPNNYLRHNYETYLDEETDTFRFSESILKSSPKICYRQTANRIIAGIDRSSTYCDKTVHVIINKDGNDFDLRYVLSLLNSELFNYLYSVISQESSGRAFSQVKTTYIKKLPFIGCDDYRIVTLVDYLEILLMHEKRLQTSYFDQLIDGIVYELYFSNDVKAAKKEILQNLGEITPFSENMINEERLAIIQKEFDRLYDPNHPVRNNLESLDSLEVVRTIRESLQRK